MFLSPVLTVLTVPPSVLTVRPSVLPVPHSVLTVPAYVLTVPASMLPVPPSLRAVPPSILPIPLCADCSSLCAYCTPLCTPHKQRTLCNQQNTNEQDTHHTCHSPNPALSPACVHHTNPPNHLLSLQPPTAQLIPTQGIHGKPSAKKLNTPHRPSHMKICPVQGCPTLKHNCWRHRANKPQRVCSAPNCLRITWRAKCQSIHCGLPLGTKVKAYTGVIAGNTPRNLSKMGPHNPQYAQGGYNTDKVWNQIRQLANSDEPLVCQCPIALKSEQDPYKITHLSSPSSKQELHEQMVRSMAAYYRMLRNNRTLGTKARVPFNEEDINQYPLLPRDRDLRYDSTGFRYNSKHYLLPKWKSQQYRCLTTTASGHQDYALRDPPIIGEIFEFYFTGYAFLDGPTTDKGERILSQVGFLMYAMGWELKGRPTTFGMSHDRVNGNRGYLFDNTRNASPTLQSNNRGTKQMRKQHWPQILNQECNKNQQHKGNAQRPGATGATMQTRISTICSKAKKAAIHNSRTKNKMKRIQHENNKYSEYTTSIRRVAPVDSKGRQRNTLYGYPQRY